LRTLVVEDDPAVYATLKTALRDFTDRENALDRASTLKLFEDSLAANRPFDLVVIDIATPEMQDGSIIRDIRQIEENFHVPPEKKARLIVISATTGRQLLTDWVFKGCDEFIDKPVDPDQFHEKLIQLAVVATLLPIIRATNSLLKTYGGTASHVRMPLKWSPAIKK
jgi:two-component system, chemotaxis family, chemotaxis protein CheY